MNKLILFIYTFFIALLVSAQQADTSIQIGNLYTKEVKNLQAQGDKLLSEYKINDALKIYLELIDMLPDNANFNFKTGLCYLYTLDEQKRAIPYLKKAIQDITFEYMFIDKEQIKAPADALYFLGKAYMAIQEPDSALKYINLFSQVSIKKIDKFNYIPSSEVFSNMRKCNFANTAKYCRFNIKRDLLEPELNTSFSETNPVLFDQGRQMFFCSDRSTDSISQDLNIYFTKLQNGKWEKPQLFQYSTVSNEVPVFVNNAADEFYLSIEGKKGIHNLYVCHKTDSKWGKPEKLKGKINSDYNDIGLAISKDLKRMLISSDRKGGYGGYDIYMLELQENGSWGKPKNLESLNTINNEISPSFSDYGDTIYYTSNCEIKDLGLGGYDIYFVPIIDGEIGSPHELKYPINSVTHDRNLSLAKDGIAYLASINRNQNFDIFMIAGFTHDIKLLKVYKPENFNAMKDYEASLGNNSSGYYNKGSNDNYLVNEIEVLERLGYVDIGDIQDLDKIIATEIIEKEVEVEVNRIIETEKEVERLVEVEKVIETEKEVERLVEVNNVIEVEKIVEVIKQGETKIEYVYLNQLNEQNRAIVVNQIVKSIDNDKTPNIESILSSLEVLMLDDLDEEQQQKIISRLKSYVVEKETEYNLKRVDDELGTSDTAMTYVKEQEKETILEKLKGLGGNGLSQEQKQLAINQIQEYISEQKRSEVRIDDRKESNEIKDIVEFEYNSYFLNYKQCKQIEKLSAKLSKNDNYYIEIIGHCDSRGDFSINNEISKKRAQAVYQQFILQKLNKDKIIFYGKGSFEPLTTNENTEGRSKNRRVEIIIHIKQ